MTFPVGTEHRTLLFQFLMVLNFHIPVRESDQEGKLDSLYTVVDYLHFQPSIGFSCSDLEAKKGKCNLHFNSIFLQNGKMYKYVINNL